MMPVPIKLGEAREIMREIRNRWDVHQLLKVGMDEMLARIVYKLMDTGDIIYLTVAEMTALMDWLGVQTEFLDIINDETLKPELKSALWKLAFAHGRNYGMTNSDMGVEPDE